MANEGSAGSHNYSVCRVERVGGGPDGPPYLGVRKTFTTSALENAGLLLPRFGVN